MTAPTTLDDPRDLPALEVVVRHRDWDKPPAETCGECDPLGFGSPCLRHALDHDDLMRRFADD